VVSGPLASIDAGGLATATSVYENTIATAQGSFAGDTGTLDLTVLDTITDNFGAYAGDGLEDRWQVTYFGLNNPAAGPLLDPDSDGQNNTFESIAGLDPTDPLSSFHWRIEPVPGQPAQVKLVFSPVVAGRTYTVNSRPTLDAGTWQPLTGTTQNDNGDERTVTDSNVTGTAKFYQVEIVHP